MKRVILVSLLLLFVWFTSTSCRPVKIDKGYEKSLEDSIVKLNSKIDTMTLALATYETYLIALANQEILATDSIIYLNDSIKRLNERPLMTKAQFLDLYKYERLLKYYKICKNNPTPWKYYRGWSTRVFEE